MKSAPDCEPVSEAANLKNVFIVCASSTNRLSACAVTVSGARFRLIEYGAQVYPTPTDWCAERSYVSAFTALKEKAFRLCRDAVDYGSA